jgi:hypothetical protein
MPNRDKQFQSRQNSLKQGISEGISEKTPVENGKSQSTPG